jgi:hypothetical protein
MEEEFTRSRRRAYREQNNAHKIERELTKKRTIKELKIKFTRNRRTY